MGVHMREAPNGPKGGVDGSPPWRAAQSTGSSRPSITRRMACGGGEGGGVRENKTTWPLIRGKNLGVA